MSEAASVPVDAGRRTPRWLWATLVVSLALNLLLIGLIVGASILRHRWGGPPLAGAAPFGYLRTLPPERREALREINRARLGSMRPLWQEVREARVEADKAFAAEPFDEGRFVAAHHRMLELDVAARKAGSQLLAEAGARMTAAERRDMLAWRDRHGRRGWRERGGRNGREDGAEGESGGGRRP